MKRPQDMTREELEAEVVYLRDHLAAPYEDQLDRLRLTLTTTLAESCLLMKLHAGQGRPVSVWALAESAPPARNTLDRDDHAVVKVWIRRIRQKIGADAVQTIYGRGYAITPQGIARVDAALGDTPQQQRSAS